LPPVCMVCGQSATYHVNQLFSHTPEWVEWLYLAGIFPGLIAAHFFTKEMRVSCPFCGSHRNHWRALYWLGGVGWLACGLPLAGIGCLVGIAIGSGGAALSIGLGVGAGVGLIAWLVALIYVYNTRIGAKTVTSSEITLQGVHDAFAKAVK